MKFQEGNLFKPDKNTEITELFDPPEGSKSDAVVMNLDGHHPADEGKRIVNVRSQKNYYILEGSGTFYVGKKEHTVEEGDFVHVQENTEHAMEGEMTALIFTCPPFNPENENLVNKN